MVEDIDCFCQYSVAYRHIVDDSAPAEVASVIQEAGRRRTVQIGRYGGEEPLRSQVETEQSLRSSSFRAVRLVAAR